MIDVMIIAQNEAANLPNCLAALQGWTHRVFVIDSGSTDGTQGIVRSFGAELIEHPWEGYARQKNWGLDNLPFESPWILIVDADEIITVPLRDQIKAITSLPLDQVCENGFFINRLTYFLNRPIRHCGYYPSWNLRLFKRGMGRYEDRAVHEHIIIADPVGFIAAPMVHNDRRGLEQYFAKHNRYSTMEAQVLASDPAPLEREAVNIPADNRRRRWLKRNVLPRIPLPHWWRFIYMYVIRRGFLDGRAGLEFCRFISTYDYMLALKLRTIKREQAERRRQGSPSAANGAPVVAAPAVPANADGQEVAPAADPFDARRPHRAAVASRAANPEGSYMERFAHLAEPGQRVLVTGGSGFIGSNVVAFYDAAGAEVLNVDHLRPPDGGYEHLWRNVDLLDETGLARVVREFRPDVLIHLAARTDLDERADLGGYAANVAGVRNVLRAMEGVDSLRRAIITSTQLVCRLGYVPRSDDDYNPHTAYGQSKVATEKITRAWRDAPCPWTLIRPTSIWGPGFGQPYKPFFLAVAKRRYLHPRGANQLRSFGFVGNGVYQLAAFLRAPVEQVAGKTFYMADYKPVRIRDWANLIREEMGVSKLREVPLSALRTAARVGDVATKLGVRRFPLTSFRLQNMLSDNVVDMSDVERIIGELPYTIEEGVRITVNWLREIGAVGGASRPGDPRRRVMGDRLLADG